jgi:hypothetical protein
MTCCLDLKELMAEAVFNVPTPLRLQNHPEGGGWGLDLYRNGAFIVRIADGLKFCPFCGAPLDGAQTPNQ